MISFKQNQPALRTCLLLMSFTFLTFGCKDRVKSRPEPRDTALKDSVENVRPPFKWEGANVYFLLTDRFHRGRPVPQGGGAYLDRNDSTAVLRGFEGGDIAGITEKIEAGYFSDLGVNAIWLTPIVEQVHGSTDEGTGRTYGYHGYWTKDWTSIDPNFGDKRDLKRMVRAAHERGIRILLDVVLNHTGPVTELDPVWPDDWVRTGPNCEFTNYENTTACTLVENLPDILTESKEEVELPDALLAKWKREKRLGKELDELQVFFNRTGYPRAPRYYIIKWLTDYIHEFGIDGFRVDTVKHVNEDAWSDLRQEADYAFETWKRKHPRQVLDSTPFFMVGEVYGYGIGGGRWYDFGDKKVDYFDHGFDGLINFDLKRDANGGYEEVFARYSRELNTRLQGKTVLNYLSSHDDGSPFDRKRSRAKRAANFLMMTPGASQLYYGDETLRSLVIEGTEGDATLRSNMNWEALDSVPEVQEIHSHYQKLGRFRHRHPAVGAGKHKMLTSTPYVFSRTYNKDGLRDKVVVGLGLSPGKKKLKVQGFFGDDTVLLDTYSDTQVTVRDGIVELDTPFDTALLELAAVAPE